jgi:DNA modification methylase
MQEIGIEEVWISQTEAKTDKEIFDLALTDNEEFGYYEQEQVAELALELGLSSLELKSYALTLGAPTTLDLILDKFGPEVEEDEVPEVDEANTYSELGEVYQLGRHRLMCGSATDEDNLETLLDGAEPDMVFTDPPYGMDYSGRGENTSNKIMGDKQDPTEFYNVGSHITERYVWGRMENYKHLFEEPRDTIIWKKNNFGMGRGYRGQYECCFYFGDFSGSDSDVWEISKDSSYDHPTQKPVNLAVRAIKNSQPTIVIDYFAGSGSTLLACEQMRRTCYAMELDPKYCDVIRKRYAKHCGEEDWIGFTPSVTEVEHASR